MNTIKKGTIVLLIAVIPTVLFGQEDLHRQDTLPAAYKVSLRNATVQGGRYSLDDSRIQKIVSPSGEADVIKYIQTLPGIATGAEGSSSVYARGGNVGNNLITLDGVPIYSSSHLLGLSTSFSPYIVKSADFYVGGFSSDDGNMTASHIKMSSADGDFKRAGAETSISNFIAGCGVSAPIVKEKLSFIGSLRFSPMGLEYMALRNFINERQTIFTDLSIFAADAFGKLKYRLDDKSSISMSVFGTMDSYSIIKGENADNGFGWTNSFVSVDYDKKNILGFDLTAKLSYNFNRSKQTMEKVLGGVYNKLELANNLNEVTLSANAGKSLGRLAYLMFGIKAKADIINPGSSKTYGSPDSSDSTPMADNKTTSVLLTAHGQVEWRRPDKFDIRIAGRFNAYFCKLGVAPEVIFDPEISAMAKINLARAYGVEVTLDYLTQHNHTLEGIPLGWSLDMIVPADKIIKPEHSHQAYMGFFGDFSQHHINVGGYAKYMQNLVYYPSAKNMFSQDISGWHENVQTGTGTSYGLETMYEMTGKTVSFKCAYTLSKTDRHFEKVNNGKSFPAKFDRRHILNAQLEYTFVDRKNYTVGFNTQFTFQSGHWETLSDGSVIGWRIMDGEEVLIPHTSGENNYKMPDYIRWDNGFNAEIRAGKVTHSVKIGVFNTLNRHNVFTLLYDEDTDRWKTLSLIPIMPSIYYKIAF